MAEVRSLVVVVRANRRRVGGLGPTESASVEYEMQNAPKAVQHAIRLLTDRWGTDLSDDRPATETRVPTFVCHAARELAQRWGVPHP